MRRKYPFHIPGRRDTVTFGFSQQFSASLRRRDNDLILHIKSIDEKPVCRFLLKPHTKQTLISTAPEVTF